MAKVEYHFGELLPRVEFIVTKPETDSRAVVRFYNQRGTAEQWIKEGKQAVKMTHLSWGARWARCCRWGGRWSLSSRQQRLAETGGG